MNTLEIIKDLSDNKLTKNQFTGVFPSDCLPKRKLKKPAFVIANTDNKYNEGEHWVCFYFPKDVNNSGEFFDSYSNLPMNPDFKKFLAANCSSYTHNKKRLQGDISTTCGNYCCMFAYARGKL